MGYRNKMTVHGIRATFSTAFNEIGYPPPWIEAQLFHSDPNAIRAAYNHAEYVEQRRQMMQIGSTCANRGGLKRRLVLFFKVICLVSGQAANCRSLIFVL
jgi:hypothetical protein